MISYQLHPLDFTHYRLPKELGTKQYKLDYICVQINHVITHCHFTKMVITVKNEINSVLLYSVLSNQARCHNVSI